MEMKTSIYNGVKYWHPLRYEFIEPLKDCCGAGDGIQERLVPETIYGLRITRACSIHDFSFEVAESDEDFILANIAFLYNIMAIIDARSANAAMRWVRRYRAMTYYNSVQELGKTAFENARRKK